MDESRVQKRGRESVVESMQRIIAVIVDDSPLLVYTSPMLARIYSCAVVGLEGVIVEVEVDTTQGFPGMDTPCP